MSKRIGTFTFALAFIMAGFVASGVAFAAKPKPAPDINDKVCQSISGVWTPHKCTIPVGIDGVASSDFKIGKGNALDVKGSLTISIGVTIANSGTIIVENVAGVAPAAFGDPPLVAGILVLGTLDNSGSITIQNASENTEGIAVSVSVMQDDPPVPNPFVVVPGVLTNSGTITILNAGNSQGINNLGTLDNLASGTITVASGSTGGGLAASVGIRNRRDGLPPAWEALLSPGSGYYITGTMTNAGRMTTANSGDAEGRGISNSGSFTNTATGTYTINPSAVSGDVAWGLRNNGSFTNFGTFTNNRGRLNDIDLPSMPWGSYNLSPGAMLNYGKTYVGTPSDAAGTFYNEFIMINFGEITSYGGLADVYGLMINYGTLYNYAQIGGGGNVGICINEPGSPGGC
jgi:hypothetical protein